MGAWHVKGLKRWQPLLATCTSFRMNPEGSLRRLHSVKREVTIISKLDCSEVLKVVLGATGALQTEGSKHGGAEAGDLPLTMQP